MSIFIPQNVSSSWLTHGIVTGSVIPAFPPKPNHGNAPMMIWEHTLIPHSWKHKLIPAGEVEAKQADSPVVNDPAEPKLVVDLVD